MSFWIRLAGVAAFGALGASCRYLVGLVAARYSPMTPWLGTLVANAVGCIVFGAVFRIALEGGYIDDRLKLWLLTGFLGAFTTFSAYAFDAVALAESRGWPAAALYLFVQNGLGIAGILTGMFLAASLVDRG